MTTLPTPLLPTNSPLLPSDPVLRQVLVALLRNRAPGFHFPGNFINLSFDKVSADDSRLSVFVGAHNSDADGKVDDITLAVLADLGVSTAIRASASQPVRMATVNLQMQIFAAPHAGRLESVGRFEGTLPGITGGQGVGSAAIRNAAGDLVCLARGAFAIMDPLAGMPAPILPRADEPEPAELPDPRRLQGEERAIYRRAEAARSEGTNFVEGFWDLRIRRTAAGASGRMPATPQVGNRNGHVQGGVMIALADRTARAALEGRWTASSISSSFLRPGGPPAVRAQARVVYRGRTTAVVRVQLFNADRKQVLEATIGYAALR